MPSGTVLDGEIVALDARSRPNFGHLQTRGKLTSPREIGRAMTTTPVHFFVFDVLRTPNRGSTTGLSYLERRRLLADLDISGRLVQVPDDLGVPLDIAVEISHELGLEGILAKRNDSTYQSGRRSRAWIKIKHDLHQEVIVIGWRHGKGGRASTFGSLLLGVWDDGELHYAGRVGTGFDEDALRAIRKKLERLRRKTPPVDDVPERDRRDAEWVTPRVVAEVRHAGRTADGKLRHSVWRGLRPDKAANDVTWET